jgi:hypothetical protein
MGEYEQWEGENDCCVDALARAFVALRDAYNQLGDSTLPEHEEATGIIMDAQGLVVDALSICRKVEKKIDKERKSRTGRGMK